MLPGDPEAKPDETREAAIESNCWKLPSIGAGSSESSMVASDAVELIGASIISAV